MVSFQRETFALQGARQRQEQLILSAPHLFRKLAHLKTPACDILRHTVIPNRCANWYFLVDCMFMFKVADERDRGRSRTSYELRIGALAKESGCEATK